MFNNSSNNNDNNKTDDAMSNDIDTFQNNNQPHASDDSSMNVISERSEIIGTLKSRRNIKVAGKIDGGVEAEGKVIVDSTGFVEGSINSDEAYVAGRVEGDIHAESKLTLASSAVVSSDLHVPNLVIEEGATFNGVCHMEEAADETSEDEWNAPDVSYQDSDDDLFGDDELDEDDSLETEEN